MPDSRAAAGGTAQLCEGMTRAGGLLCLTSFVLRPLSPTRLQAHAAALGVADVQLRLTPLEEVFLTIARKVSELSRGCLLRRWFNAVRCNLACCSNVCPMLPLPDSPAAPLSHPTARRRSWSMRRPRGGPRRWRWRGRASRCRCPSAQTSSSRQVRSVEWAEPLGMPLCASGCSDASSAAPSRCRADASSPALPAHPSTLRAAGHLYHIRWGQDPDSGELRLAEYWRADADPFLEAEAEAAMRAGSAGSEGEAEGEGWSGG